MSPLHGFTINALFQRDRDGIMQFLYRFSDRPTFWRSSHSSTAVRIPGSGPFLSRAHPHRRPSAPRSGGNSIELERTHSIRSFFSPEKSLAIQPVCFHILPPYYPFLFFGPSSSKGDSWIRALPYRSRVKGSWLPDRSFIDYRDLMIHIGTVRFNPI